MVDANGNHSEAAFNALGQVIAVAAKGKKIGDGWEGDDLSGFDFARCNPPPTDVQAFCTATTLDESRARDWLDRATTRLCITSARRGTMLAMSLPGLHARLAPASSSENPCFPAQRQRQLACRSPWNVPTVPAMC